MDSVKSFLTEPLVSKNAPQSIRWAVIGISAFLGLSVAIISMSVLLSMTPNTEKPGFGVSGQNSCSSLDKDLMDQKGGGHADSSFPSIMHFCGQHNYGLFGGLNRAGASTCLQDKLGISAPCGTCLVTDIQYGVQNCKMPCMLNWCSHACLECGRKGKPTTTDVCAGVPLP